MFFWHYKGPQSAHVNPFERASASKEFKQFSVLQNALLNLASGKAHMQMDSVSAINGFHLSMPSQQEQLACLEWDFWYDYFGCPQMTGTGTASQQKLPDIQAVVNSIPAYCGIADFTLVLAPAIKHTDSGTTISQRTWSLACA